MEITIRQYEERDRAALMKCLEDLQDHEASLDPLKHVVRKEGFGEPYTAWILEAVAKEDGVIYMAEDNGTVIGFIGSVIKHNEKQEVLARSNDKPYGHTYELFVADAYRNQGIGARLMEKVENYFREKGCELASVYAVASNTRAWDFYKKNGYFERYINLYKKI